MKSVILSLFALVIFASCTKMEKDGGNDSASGSIQELNKQFISAWNSKDSDKAIAMMADDIQFLQGETHYRGKSEVSDKWVRQTISTINDLKLYVVSSGSDEKMAYEAGTFSVDVLPTQPNEPLATGEGNFTLLWKKAEDGNWKLSLAQLEDLPLQVKNGR